MRTKGQGTQPVPDPELTRRAPDHVGLQAPSAEAAHGREVWLDQPWSPKRWAFVQSRMPALAPLQWQGSAAQIGVVLAGARSVRSLDEPHLAPCLSRPAL